MTSQLQPEFLNPRVMIWLALALGLSVATACTGGPKLTEYPIDRSPAGSKAIKDSPLVLVATLGSDVPVSRIVRSHWNPEVDLQLHKLTINVENVLRGDLRPGAQIIYYFHFASTTDGPPALGHWKPGDRKLLYVRRDSGVLRLACDGSNRCTVSLGSGAHPNIRVNSGQPLDAVLAEIVLTKGEGVSDWQFANSLEPLAGGIARQYAIPKLRALAANNNANIRKAACYSLRSDFNLPCEAKEGVKQNEH